MGLSAYINEIDFLFVLCDNRLSAFINYDSDS